MNNQSSAIDHEWAELMRSRELQSNLTFDKKVFRDWQQELIRSLSPEASLAYAIAASVVYQSAEENTFSGELDIFYTLVLQYFQPRCLICTSQSVLAEFLGLVYQRSGIQRVSIVSQEEHFFCKFMGDRWYVKKGKYAN